MKRLLEAQAVLSELLGLDESLLSNCRQLDDFADDIFKKLTHIRSSVLSGPTHSHALASPNSAYSPSPSWSSSCASPVSFHSRNAITLAHHSYSHMVDDASTEVDGIKLAHYWVDFIDRAFDPHATPSLRVELLDARCEALEALYVVDDDLREQTAGRRLLAATDAYKIALLVYRPFHLASLRRLQRLGRTLNELQDVARDTNEFREADEVYGSSLRRSWRDRGKYEDETKCGYGIGKTDTDAVVAVEVLQALQHERSPAYLSRSSSAESDKIVDKVFMEDMVYRL